LAALSVLAYHVWYYAPGEPPDLGQLGTAIAERLPLGVTLFFTLSGFLLYRPFASAILAGRPLPNLYRYARNRVLRILPAYWVAVILAGAAGMTIVRWSGGQPELGQIIAEPALLARHLLLLQNYDVGTVYTGVGPAWSLAVEVIFYGALPILAALAVRAGRRATSPRGRLSVALLPPAALLILGLASKRAAETLAGPEKTLALISFPALADLFSFGMVAAVMLVLVQERRVTLPASWRRWTVFATLAGLAAAQCIPLTAPLYQTAMALVFSLSVAAVVLPGPADRPLWRPVRALEAPALVWVGLISYSLYLWHEPIVHALNELDVSRPGLLGLPINLALVTAAAVTVAGVVYRLVELPALNRKGPTAPAHADAGGRHGGSHPPPAAHPMGEQSIGSGAASPGEGLQQRVLDPGRLPAE